MAKVKTAGEITEQGKQPVPDHEPTRAEIEERAYYRYVDRGASTGSMARIGTSPRQSFAAPAIRELGALDRFRCPTGEAPSRVPKVIQRSRCGSRYSRLRGVATRAASPNQAVGSEAAGHRI